MAKRPESRHFSFAPKLRTRLVFGFFFGFIAVLGMSLVTIYSFGFISKQQGLLSQKTDTYTLVIELSDDMKEVQIAASRFVQYGHDAAFAKATQLLEFWSRELEACARERCLDSRRLNNLQTQIEEFRRAFKLVGPARKRIAADLENDFPEIAAPPDAELFRTAGGAEAALSALHVNSIQDHIYAIGAALRAYFVSSDHRRAAAAQHYLAELKLHLKSWDRGDESLPTLSRETAPFGNDIDALERLMKAHIQRIRSYSYLINVVMPSEAGELEFVTSEIAVEFSEEIDALRASLDDARLRFYQQLIAIVVSIVLLTIPVFFWVLRSVTTPITHLAEVFRRLAAGSEVDFVQQKDSHDEISDLYRAAKSFRDENIREHQLLADYRALSESLEAEVARRTQELQSKNDELDRLASHDKLTGVYNRRFLDKSLDDEIARIQRYRRQLAVFILDIDRFKTINDEHGHLSGDRVLVQLAELVGSTIRESDILGRWGGEEFLVLCPEASIEQAHTAAEKVRISVEQAVFDVPVSISISIGVSAFLDGDTAENLISRADKALYRAKSTGRNRTCVAALAMTHQHNPV